MPSADAPAVADSRRWNELPHSVFARLVAVMLAMAMSLLLLVGFFFFLIVGPNVHSSIDRLVVDYLRQVAASHPDLAAARQLKARLNIDVRFEGHTGEWSTSASMPSVAAVQQGRAPAWRESFIPRSFVVLPGDGGEYLFAWSVGTRLREVHFALIVLLLLVMLAVVAAAWLVLNRLLAPLRLLNDGVARLSAGELDVTLPRQTRDEFGRLTEAFNHMVGRVRAMLRARDQLLIDVSHELRSPVTRMKVALELSPDNPQRAGMAEDLAEVDRMITELLELERLRSGRGLQCTRQDLLPILRELVPSYREHSPGVHLNIPPEPVIIDADVEKVRSVFRNLLENAAKYSLPESRPVEITVEREPQRIVVRVVDDGPGIPESDIDRVFEPFYRADPSRSKSTGGYGLGLSICKRIMQAHGGDIVLARGSHRGAQFWVTFPSPR